MLRTIVKLLGLVLVVLIPLMASTQIPPTPPINIIANDPIFGPICMGPLGPGPCADVQRFLRIHAVASTIVLQQIDFHPAFGPICQGPLGPGPCEQIRFFIATQRVAMQEVQPPQWRPVPNLCLGPFGPAPCDAVRTYVMQSQVGVGVAPQQFAPSQPQVAGQLGPSGEPMCMSPTEPMPCTLVAQIGLDLMGGNLPQQSSFGLPSGIVDSAQLAQECAKRVGVDVAAFSACSGGQAVLRSDQEAILECAISSSKTEDFAKCAAPKLGISLSDDQRKVAGCAIAASGGEAEFRACAGQAVSGVLTADDKAILDCARNSQDAVVFGNCAAKRFMGKSEKAIVECAIDKSDAVSFAICAAPYSGLSLSDDQRVVARCAAQANGDAAAFATCTGSGVLGSKLGPKEQAVLGCAADSGGDSAKFAGCSANTLFGDKLSREQQVAVQCAAQSQGDATGFATCAGANLLNLQLNPEQQIAVQCIAATGGQPHLAAGCMASRLTARELSKCLNNGIGGKDGCFGDNNDLVGKDGWVGRNIRQLAGGPNSVINNPGQIWGGDNSFINNPSQLLPQPRPLQVGSIGGKRICLPWC